MHKEDKKATKAAAPIPPDRFSIPIVKNKIEKSFPTIDWKTNIKFDRACKTPQINSDLKIPIELVKRPPITTPAIVVNEPNTLLAVAIC